MTPKGIEKNGGQPVDPAKLELHNAQLAEHDGFVSRAEETLRVLRASLWGSALRLTIEEAEKRRDELDAQTLIVGVLKAHSPDSLLPLPKVAAQAENPAT